MNASFKPDCRSALVGSLPVTSHDAASRLVWDYSADIPLWVQLPSNPVEDMIVQFLPGMPGLTHGEKGPYVNTNGSGFDSSLVDFYAEYLAVTEEGADINSSRFAMTPDVAPGFFVLLEALEAHAPPVAVKGQVTGPVTLCTSLVDQEKTAVFYHEQLRDAAVKLIGLKAAWQVRRLSGFHVPVIIFIDEPSLAGLGSSEFTSISKDQVKACLGEVIDMIHAQGGLAGVHVCANTDWTVVLESEADIVNFDAYSYFDRFILYPGQITRFVSRGGMLAWGIVPTFPETCIEQETVQTLTDKLNAQMNTIRKLGVDRERIFSQSLITPSCGTGSLSIAHAERVLELTKGVSRTLREHGTVA